MTYVPFSYVPSRVDSVPSEMIINGHRYVLQDKSPMDTTFTGIIGLVIACIIVAIVCIFLYKLVDKYLK